MGMAVREKIRVAVIFGPGERIAPVWFEWRQRKYTICETTYQWSDRQGNETCLHFSVSDGAGLYELVYHTQARIWRLWELQPDYR